MKPTTALYCIPRLAMCYIDYHERVLLGVRLSPYFDSVAGYKKSDFSDMVFAQILEYIDGKRKEFDCEIDISKLTNFQQIVLNALMQIPYGESISYKQLAEKIGNPKAVRAVAVVCKRNPIHIIIPCHRIIGVGGKLVGYAAGLEIKAHLLALEGCEFYPPSESDLSQNLMR